MTTPKLCFFIKVLSFVGIGLALYLLWEQFSSTPLNLCTVNSSINCDAIISGEVSKTFGVSTPIYGLIGYVAILLLAMYRKRKAMLGVAIFGVVFCLWIAYQEFLLKTVCPVCIGCQIVMIAILVLSIMVYVHKPSKVRAKRRSK